MWNYFKKSIWEPNEPFGSRKSRLNWVNENERVGSLKRGGMPIIIILLALSVSQEVSSKYLILESSRTNTSCDPSNLSLSYLTFPPSFLSFLSNFLLTIFALGVLSPSPAPTSITTSSFYCVANKTNLLLHSTSHRRGNSTSHKGGLPLPFPPLPTTLQLSPPCLWHDACLWPDARDLTLASCLISSICCLVCANKTFTS